MSNHSITAAAIAAILFSVATLHSQAPSKTGTASLQAIKAANAQLIERQEKTLQGLDELQKAVEQLKVMGKRS